MARNELLAAALDYSKRGFSVIPVKHGDKRPLIAWQEFQKRRAEEKEITSWWSSYPDANIGIVTGEISNLFVIDIDTEEGQTNIDAILSDSVECPIVKTPRGGQHLYFTYPKGINLTIGAGVIPGTDFRGNGGFVVAPPSVNGNGNSYSWLVAVGDAPLSALPEAYIIALSTISTKTLFTRGVSLTDVRSEITTSYSSYTILQKGRRDNDLFHLANCLIKGGCELEIARQAIGILANNSNPPFPQSEVNAKIESALKRAERRERNLADEIREWCFLQDGYFFITDVLQSLQIITKEEKNNTHVVLKRLCDSGIIEKYGEKRGCYRLRVTNIQEMDLKSEPEVNEVNVRMPLQLNDMCVLSPGNIVVVAGSKSAGKTAMVLNIAAFNQNKFNVVYLNSEMSETEFKKRLKRFMPLSDWNIKAYKCHNNFDDYIESNPKNLYIVDFLEVHDNFYEIAKPIRKIHEKLGDSLCFIAIHMKLGNSLGRGGDFSAEKARLYLTMDYMEQERQTKVTIYDAKEPRPPHESVRGMWRHVKIINGSELKYSPAENWRW
jgi:hypothetical protein